MTVVKAVHLSNAPDPIVSTFAGILTFVSGLRTNAYAPIVFNFAPFSNVISFSLQHPEKALFPMDSIFAVISIDVKNGQSANAPSPIFTKVDGRTMEFKRRPLNDDSPMLVNTLGKIKCSIFC